MITSSFLELLGVSGFFFPVGAKWTAIEPGAKEQDIAAFMEEDHDEWYCEGNRGLVECFQLLPDEGAILVIHPFALFQMEPISESNVFPEGELQIVMNDTSWDAIVEIEDRAKLFAIGLRVLDDKAKSGHVESCCFVTVWRCENEHINDSDGEDYDVHFRLLGRLALGNEAAILAATVDKDLT